MDESAESGICVSHFNSDDNTVTSIPYSPDIKESFENVPMTTLSLNHEDNNSDHKTWDINTVNPYSCNNSLGKVQENANSIQQANQNLVIMSKIQSLVVPIIILCLLILLFQIPIILYYTDGPSDDLFSWVDELDFKTFSVRFMYIATYICTYIANSLHM